MSRRPQFRVWYAVWVNSESTVFLMRRSKKAAKAAIADARKDFPECKFGLKRLIEKVETRRRRRSRRQKRG